MATAFIGHGIIPTGGAPLTEAVINFSTTGDNTVVSGTASQTIRVFRIFFVSSASTTITIKDGAGTSLTGAMTMGQGGGFTLDYQQIAWFTTSSGNGFVISQTGTAQISGRIYYQKT